VSPLLFAVIAIAVMSSPLWLPPLVGWAYGRAGISDADMLAVAHGAGVTPAELAAYTALNEATDERLEEIRAALAECHRLDSTALWLDFDATAP